MNITKCPRGATACLSMENDTLTWFTASLVGGPVDMQPDSTCMLDGRFLGCNIAMSAPVTSWDTPRHPNALSTIDGGSNTLYQLLFRALRVFHY